MRLLLDTHALLWWLEDERLGPAAAAAVRDPDSDVLASAASAWEIAIKARLGKLDAPSDLRDSLHEAQIRELCVTVEHGLAAGALPLHHADPFDRMLVAQARLERLTLVTNDPAMAAYDVALLAAAS